MPVNVAQLVVSVGANTAMAEQGIMGLARMLGAGGPLALGAIGAGLAIVGVGAAATKMAGDFQTQLTQLVTGAGEAQSNLGMIRDGVLRMARDTGTSTKQLTDGLYMIESAGIHGSAALKVLQAAAEGAKVGNADLGTVADAVTTILKNYPNVVDGANGATNALIATVSQGKTHMQDLAGALSSVLPAAQAAGVGLNDVLAAMAAQTAAGVPAADAATHLRQLLIALEAPSSAASKALQAVGLNTDEVAAAMKKSLPDALQLIQKHMADTYGEGSPKYVEALKNISGGMREMQGMLLLTSKTGMADFQTDLKNISGDVQEGGDQIRGWNLVQQTFNQQMSRLAEIFQTLMIQLGEKFLPIATQVAKFFADHLAPATDAVAKPVAAVAQATQVFARHLSDVQGPAEAVHGLISKLEEPAKTVGGAMRAMAGGAQTLHQEYGGLIKPVSDLAGPLADLRGAFAAVGQAMQNASTTISGDAQPVLQQMRDFFVQQLLPAVTQFTTFAATTLVPMFAQIADFILKNVVPALLQLAGWFLKYVLPAVEQLVTFFQKNVLPILENFVTTLEKDVVPWIERVGQVILTKWLPPLERIGADLLPMLNPLLAQLGWLFQNVIGPSIAQGATNVGNLLQGLADLLDGIKHFIEQPSVKSFNDFMRGMANANSNFINGATGNMFHLPHFASGGMMAETGLALVGEAGPELVSLPGGAQVTPLASLGSASLPAGSGYGGAGGGAQTITINLTNTLDGRVIGQQVVKIMPNLVRTGTGNRGF